mgnify:CR=1 FL=1|jgi:hypothetical protein
MSRAPNQKNTQIIKRELALKVNLKKRKKFKEKIKKNDSVIR